MGLIKGTGKFLAKIIGIRPREWVSYDLIKTSVNYISTSVKALVIPEEAQHNETFEESMARLNITEEDLKMRKREFTRLLIFYLSASTATFCYSIYIGLHGNIMGFLLGFAVTIFTLANAFRFHFWLYQIKKRKLGCTFKEWLNDGIK